MVNARRLDLSAASFKKQEKVNLSKINFVVRMRRRWAQNEREARIAAANESVQVREFDGKLFLCYDDVPLIEESLLNAPICAAVNASRDTVLKWHGLI